MKRYQRILVCIEEPERDRGMLHYVGTICRAAETKEVHLLHVETEKPQLMEELKEVGAAKSPVTSDTLKDLAANQLTGHGNEKVICKVVSGAPLIEILRYMHDQDIDLIVIGRRAGGGKDTEHEAALARRITRKATCSVLVLPEDAKAKMDKILAPVRDSECSANALEMACRIAEISKGTAICLTVFEVHSGYLSIGTSLEEHTAIMEKWAQRECEQLLERVDKGSANIEIKCLPDLYRKPVPIILDVEEGESADLVVIGARGRTGAAGVLLGKVPEKLIQQSSLPLLAVKKKGECLGLVQALLSLAGEGE
ncbi:MAG: universal stress protein [Planctomycetota bacterium]|nr:MAG: universal stress protein [Planctomycetota bacterium]